MNLLFLWKQQKWFVWNKLQNQAHSTRPGWARRESVPAAQVHQLKIRHCLNDGDSGLHARVLEICSSIQGLIKRKKSPSLSESGEGLIRVQSILHILFDKRLELIKVQKAKRVNALRSAQKIWHHRYCIKNMPVLKALTC